MGLKLGKILNSGAGKILSGGLAGPAYNILRGKSGNAHGGSGPGAPINPNAFPLRDPNSINPVTGLAPGQSTRRSLSDILSDPAYQENSRGNSVDDAAYQNYEKSSDAEMQRENNLGVEGVLNNLQGRGLARSGIALKDIVSQVLGPQQEKSQQLAAQFGLEQAKTRADANAQARQGRLSAILANDNANNSMDQQNLQGQQAFRQGQLTGNFGVETNSANNQEKTNEELAKEEAARDTAKTARRTGFQDKIINGGANALESILGGL